MFLREVSFIWNGYFYGELGIRVSRVLGIVGIDYVLLEIVFRVGRVCFFV